MVVAILLAIIVACASLTYFIPQGEFLRDDNGDIILDSYTESGIKGISVLNVITAPFRVFASEDGLTIIMISVFLLVMSGIFNILEKTGGTKILIMNIMKRFRDKGGPVVCITILIFMLFGSLFGKTVIFKKAEPTFHFKQNSLAPLDGVTHTLSGNSDLVGNFGK